MARYSVILMFMIWLSWQPGDQPTPTMAHFLLPVGAMAGAIVGLNLYCRRVARRIGGPRFQRGMDWYHRVTRMAWKVIPVWFAAMVYLLDYPLLIREHLGPVRHWPVESPAFVLGTLPAVLAWVGFWWAGYPAERAQREQRLLGQLEAGEPVYCAPTLGEYMLANVRMQLMFVYGPVLCIMALRDVVTCGMVAGGVKLDDAWQVAIVLATLVPFVLVVPLLLIRILPTEPLPDSPLRRQLEELCRRNGLKASNILLWNTSGTTGNAAVMGIVPHVRYLLVSDVLLERMPAEQIVAVFAHEIGHVAHRHLLWMSASAFAILFVISGPVDSCLEVANRFYTLVEPYRSLVGLAIVAPLFYFAFGWLVRRIERQADVFAARTVVQMIAQPPADPTDPGKPVFDQTFVTPGGAWLVGEALNRIAQVNNISVSTHEWLHGSIVSRMDFLRRLSADPQQTWQFDQFMRRLYVGILVVVLAMGIWTIWNVYR